MTQPTPIGQERNDQLPPIFEPMKKVNIGWGAVNTDNGSKSFKYNKHTFLKKKKTFLTHFLDDTENETLLADSADI